MTILFICLQFAFASLFAPSDGISFADRTPKLISVSSSAKASLNNQPFLLSIETIASSPIVDVKLGFAVQKGQLTPYKTVKAEVFNESDEEILVLMRLQDNKWVVGAEVILPRSKSIIQTYINRDNIPEDLDTILFGMDGLPGGIMKLGGDFDPDLINSIHFVFPLSKKGQKISISKIWVENEVDFNIVKNRKNTFFPFIDQFGQYKYDNFEGKISNEKELKDAVLTETKDLLEHPSPEEWDQYGGWKNGPGLDSTGHFRTEKYNGKWWLVTPNGHLFWSHGVNCVDQGSPTPITNRQHYFEYLPDRNLLNGVFYSKREGAPRGYYKGIPFEQVDFRKLNLYRKYGENYSHQFTQRAHKRLKSWGLNTIGNWSSDEVMLERKTPYVRTIDTESIPISGTSTQRRKFPDPYDPLFRKNLIKSMEKEVAAKTVSDPMCIGYFVDNELNWGSEMSLAETVLTTDRNQPAKQQWIQFLKKKYLTVNFLNEKWGSNYKKWEELMDVNSKKDKMDEDLTRFSQQIADQYFTEIRSVLKKYAPHKLYLGSRMDFHFYPTEELGGAWVVELAARYCDVVSFNRYRYTAEDLVFHDQRIDKPIIIGEVHFCTLDRGKFQPGLRSAKDQDHRRRLYEYYYKGALSNPFIIGVHWFQFADQATTGRFDGENSQTGFVSITDNPYRETIEASRYIGQNMYRFRVADKK